MKKIALVTGARRGIGLGITKALAKAGYTVLMSATASLEKTQAVLDGLRASGADVSYFPCDISKAADRAALFAHLEAAYGRLDVLVNNAGVAPKERSDVLETTEESFDFVVRTNLYGTYFMTQAGANAMLAMQQECLEDYHPRIVNICSMSAYTSSTNRGEYCVSKAGIAMVTQLFADRLAEAGIPVFEVRPGIIRTDMTAGVSAKYEKLIAQGVTPIRRFGSPEDVAGCVLAAVSGNLDFATGQVLNADGGFHIRRL